jgi:hypothetical protein
MYLSSVNGNTPCGARSLPQPAWAEHPGFQNGSLRQKVNPLSSGPHVADPFRLAPKAQRSTRTNTPFDAVGISASSAPGAGSATDLRDQILPQLAIFWYTSPLVLTCSSRQSLPRSSEHCPDRDPTYNPTATRSVVHSCGSPLALEHHVPRPSRSDPHAVLPGRPVLCWSPSTTSSSWNVNRAVWTMPVPSRASPGVGRSICCGRNWNTVMAFAAVLSASPHF